MAAWLAGIIVNLLTMGDYYDIALRDFGLCWSRALSLLAAGRPRDHDRGARRVTADAPHRTVDAVGHWRPRSPRRARIDPAAAERAAADLLAALGLDLTDEPTSPTPRAGWRGRYAEMRRSPSST